MSMNEYEVIESIIAGNFNKLKEKADNAAIVKFGTKCSGIGCLFPEIYKKYAKEAMADLLKKPATLALM